MKESIWGYAIITLGILAVGIIWFFANTTKTDQHNYYLIKETVESAMYDAVDLSAYREDGTIKIIEEKFVENFIRRFAENADLSNEYKIDIYDISEEPPKVSLRVSSKNSTTATGELVEFNMINNIDAILEAKYNDKTVTYVSLPGSAVSSYKADETGTSGHYCQVLKVPEGATRLISIKNINIYVNEKDIEYYNEGNWYDGYISANGNFVQFPNGTLDVDPEQVLKPDITNMQVKQIPLPDSDSLIINIKDVKTEEKNGYSYTKIQNAGGQIGFNYEGNYYKLISSYNEKTVTTVIQTSLQTGTNQIYFETESGIKYYYACFNIIGDCDKNGAEKCTYPFRYDVVWE